MSQTSTGICVTDGRHDFDFLFGRWNIPNSRLRHPLTGSTEWYEFSSTSTEMPLLAGFANLEQYDAPIVDGRSIHALALRLYDVKSHEWSIYWSTVGSGAFGIPTTGRFRNRIGYFFDHEEY